MADTTIEDKLIFRLDWSTRHLKHLQKQYPPTPEQQLKAIEMFEVMRVCLDILGIDISIWEELVGLPHKKHEELYSKLFTPREEPFHIHNIPMQKPMIYEDLICKLLRKNRAYYK